MADVTPVTSGTGFNGRTRDSLWLDTATNTVNSIYNYNRLRRHQRFTHRAAFFLDIDNSDDWAANRGVCATAWQANTTSDHGGVNVSTQGAVRFTTGATNPDGWIHILVGGAARTITIDDELPVAKGQPGYVPQGVIFANHKSDTPDTLASGRRVYTSNLKMQFYPFDLSGDASDRWRATTLRLCPGIVAVAFQGDYTALQADDRVAATLDAAGDVIMTGQTPVAGAGVLWVWRRNA